MGPRRQDWHHAGSARSGISPGWSCSGSIGIFLIKAAIEYDPNEAVGLDGALAKIVARARTARSLLGVVAAGLIAFALYSLSDARYRRI